MTMGIGLIGLGIHGRGVLPLNRQNSQHARIVAAADLDADKASLASQFNVDTFVTDPQALIALPQVDVVAVFTPDHEQLILDALAAGKHVISTKPLAFEIQGAGRILAAARKAQRHVMVIETYRLERMSQAVRTLIDQGQIGQVLLAEAAYVHDLRPVWDKRPWRKQANSMLYTMVHPLSFVRWFVGDAIKVACAAQRSPVGPEGRTHPDNFVGTLWCEQDRLATTRLFTGVVEPPMPMFTYGIYGDQGSIVNEVMTRDELRSFGHRPDGLDKHIEHLRMPLVGFNDRGRHDRTLPEAMVHFAQVIQQQATPICPLESAVKDLATLLAMIQAHETKQVVDVDYRVLDV